MSVSSALDLARGLQLEQVADTVGRGLIETDCNELVETLARFELPVECVRSVG